MGEEGEDTSRKSFTKRIQRSDRTSRSSVAAHGKERDEVGKKKRRRKKK
jgi:hypothetical protein